MLLAVVVLTAPALRIECVACAQPARERVETAAREALTSYERWLGPLEGDAIAIELPSQLTSRAPQPFMEIESYVAYDIALRYWRTGSNAPAPIAKSLSWYLQSRVVERIFNNQYGVLAHSGDGVRAFGGFVPWPLPSLRLTRWTAGVTSVDAHRRPPDIDATIERGAVAFAALERHLGWPALQGALQVLAERHSSLSNDDVEAIISRATGQDLRWFFHAAFDPQVSLDYAIRAFATSSGRCDDAACYRTTVSVERRGTAEFKQLRLHVRFADGQEVTTAWDGRDATRTFSFESPASPIEAELDPDRALLLDVTPLDNVRAIESRTNVPIAKWVARWMVWLQDAMLVGSSFL
jgi:hypothetical protein